MTSRYDLFLKVVELGSFTKAGATLHYSQSAISQAVKALEERLGTRLLDRSKEPMALTADGQAYLPYFLGIVQAERALERKEDEMRGLLDAHVRLGIFTSVGRTLLPPLLYEFKERYPGVRFDLSQGEYDSIRSQLVSAQIDLGFLNEQGAGELGFERVYRDRMVVVLSRESPLAAKEMVSLKELATEPYIELDEGRRSVAVEGFHALGLEPRYACKVYDDYTILSMVRQGLGYSILYSLAVTGADKDVAVRPITEKLERSIVLAYTNEATLPLAARRFLEFARLRLPSLVRSLGLAR
ncbi:MAG: LysR family transcriptional regulator [Sphaerochaetaceae bacterium]|nr:LysR family transcriptional regulator [Spirochaetales bacterium]MDY5499243.1 LysR family transcriptional regulator [Sphaerochaetaceae bacterium]